MRRSRITITLQQPLLEKIDHLIDGDRLRNRSHAIEYILTKYVQKSIHKAIILAGGQGTKLRPYTYEVPKSMLPIKGRPLLEYTIENLKKNSITDIIISIGYLGDQIKKHFSNGEKFGVNITYLEEKIPLQTGGSIRKLKSKINNQTFIVLHGDILTTLNVADLILFHREHKSMATIAMTTVKNPESYGQLQLHGTTLVKFYQQTAKSQIISNLINCGMYVFETSIFQYFPNQESFLLEDIIETLIKRKKVTGFVFEGQWFDVGNLENYEKAIKEFQYSNQKVLQ
ncbi:MAG: sugar phosphate nucleotidyltransferase [bacterium]|nr:sugar phosphate nucleotidyltransferase [bacterium]